MDIEKELVESYAKLRSEHKKLKDQSAEIWHQVEAVERKLLDHMDDVGKTRSASYPGIGFVSTVAAIDYKRDPANDVKLYQYLEDINRDDLISTSVNTNSLKSFIKQTIEDQNNNVLDAPELPEFLNHRIITKLKLYAR